MKILKKNLSSLVRDTLDTSSALHAASHNIESASASRELARQADLLVGHATQLQGTIDLYGDEPPVQGTFLGGLRSRWLDVRSFLDSHDVRGILRLAHSLQSKLISKYEDTLRQTDPGPYARAVLQLQGSRLSTAIYRLEVLA